MMKKIMGWISSTFAVLHIVGLVVALLVAAVLYLVPWLCFLVSRSTAQTVKIPQPLEDAFYGPNFDGERKPNG